jgi:tripartite-type tricarboxylate transporter receptor subunit TctC
MAKVCENENFKADMAKMSYRGAYLPTEEAKEFIYDKRDNMAKLIEVCPSFDYLTSSKK